MDPLAALRDIIQAMMNRDRSALQDHCEGLAQWVANGGFLPDAQSVTDMLIDVAEVDLGE